MTRKESIEIIWSNKGINSLSKVESTKIIDRIYDDFESRTCSNCKYWNIPDIVKAYGNNVCSQYRKVKFNVSDSATAKIETNGTDSCHMWEGKDE